MSYLKSSLFFIFVLSYVIIYYLIDLNKNYQINSQLSKSSDELKLHYDITQYYNKKTANAISDILPNNQKIIDILSEASTSNKQRQKYLREELYKLLEHKFKSLNKQGVKIFTISFANNKVFLRMHKKDRFGDDISEVRPSIVHVNKTKQALSGFEQGKYSHAFRNIYPLFDKNNKYLGSYDIAFSSQSVQRTLDDVNKIHSHFLVSKHIVSKEVWNNAQSFSKYKQSIEHNKFLIFEIEEISHLKIDISRQTIKENKKLINEKIRNSKEFSILGAKNDDLIVISFLPIKNILNEDIVDAYIVAYTYNEEIAKLLTFYKAFNIFLFIFLCVIFYLIYEQIINKKKLIIEVDKKTKELKELNENLELKIEEETQKNRQKDAQIYEHARNAQMGEMIGNIAHQWRQPLSLISTVASGQKLKTQLDLVDKEDSIKNLDLLNDTAQHLSKTIDIFRDFIKEKKEFKKVVLQDRIDYAIKIIEASLNNNHIKLINKIDYENKIEVQIVLGELSEVLINLFNNAKDAFQDKKIDEKYIQISLFKKDEMAVICIKDNAGGIANEVLPKIFDPYFTTKHQSQGTGVGLYMSSQIIKEHLNGNIYAKNVDNGAEFYVELPLLNNEIQTIK